MREGMLWFDNDPQRDLKQKVERAAAHYRQKFGRRPDVCYVHPEMIEPGETDSVQQVGGVEIATLPSVLRHHFWIGEEQRVTV